ncbi:MAG: hypothetical protein GX558_09875 [Clostridiales bacterium]|nr:hypothetical protein [Clostridiales bacterium]
MENRPSLSAHIKAHPFAAWAIGGALVTLALLALWPALTFDGRYRAARIAYFIVAATFPVAWGVVLGRKEKDGKPKKELGLPALLAFVVVAGVMMLGLTRTADLVAGRLAGAPQGSLNQGDAAALIENQQPLVTQVLAEMYIPAGGPDADWSALERFLAVRRGEPAPADWGQDAAGGLSWETPDKAVSGHPDKDHSPAMARLFQLGSFLGVRRQGAEVVFESGPYGGPAEAFLYYSPGDRFLWPPYDIGEVIDHPEMRLGVAGDEKVKFRIERLAPGWFYVRPIAGE